MLQQEPVGGVVLAGLGQGLAGEIARDGILLAGGGELLRRFADRLRRDPRRQRRPVERRCVSAREGPLATLSVGMRWAAR